MVLAACVRCTLSATEKTEHVSPDEIEYLKSLEAALISEAQAEMEAK